MRVLGISTSPRPKSNSDLLLRRTLAGAESAGAQSSYVRLCDLKIFEDSLGPDHPKTQTARKNPNRPQKPEKPQIAAGPHRQPRYAGVHAWPHLVVRSPGQAAAGRAKLPRKRIFLAVQGECGRIIDLVPRRAGTGWKKLCLLSFNTVRDPKGKPLTG